MKNSREGVGPFSQPTPSEDGLDDTGGIDAVRDEIMRGDGQGNEIAPDPISEITAQITAVSEKYTTGAIDAVRYVDQILPLIAGREDRIRHHHPSNKEVVRKFYDAKSVRLSAIVNDFNYGELVDMLHPLSGMSDQEKETRSLVRTVADYSLAYRPFLYVMNAGLPPGRVSFHNEKNRFGYNPEEIKKSRELWQEIFSLSETKGESSDGNKKKGLAALVMLAFIAETKMVGDIQTMLEKPGSVASRGEEEFWEHYLIGSPRDEGIVFCRNYVNAASIRTRESAKELYGDIGDRVVVAWNTLMSGTFTSETQRYVGTQLLEGKIQGAERALQKISEEDHASFQPEKPTKQSIRTERKNKRAEEAIERKRADESDAREFLERYKGHLLFNVDSMKRGDLLDFVYIPAFQEEGADTSRFACSQIQLCRGYSMHQFSNPPLAINLAWRIRFGKKQYEEMRNIGLSEKQTDTISERERLLPGRVNAGAPLIDAGLVEIPSKDLVRAAALLFFKSDVARILWGSQRDAVIDGLESIQGYGKILKEKDEQGERMALEELLSQCRHVFIRPTRYMGRADQSSQLKLTYIIGVVSADDALKKDRASFAQSSIGTIQNPVLLTRHISFSSGGKIVKNEVVNARSFFRIEKDIKSSVDMGKHDELTGELAIKLRAQYIQDGGVLED